MTNAEQDWKEVFEKYGSDDFLDGDDEKVEYDAEKPLHGGHPPWWDA